MFQPAKVSRVVIATFALSLAAGCAAPPPPPSPRAPQTSSSAHEPELAGAWYQVYFESNKVDINERGQMIVKNVAYVVDNTTGARVTVIGKTDRSGDAATNMALSQKRADQVRDALIAAGVPPSRIDTSWTGETKQQISTADDTAEKRNRVVDITVVKPQGTAYRQGN